MLKALSIIAEKVPEIGWDLPALVQLGQRWATWLLWLFRVYGFALLCPRADEQVGSRGSSPSGEWEELDRAYAAVNYQSQPQPELGWRNRRRFGKVTLIRMTYGGEDGRHDTGRQWCWWTKWRNNSDAPSNRFAGLRRNDML